MRKIEDQKSKKRILIVSPDIDKTLGGISTVVKGISTDKFLNEQFDISLFSTYRDGNLISRIIYCIFAYIRFLFVFRKYEMFHIHMASSGSTFRKFFYFLVIRYSGRKAVIHIHGSKYLVFYNNLSKFWKRFVIHFLQKSDMVIALSQGWKDIFTSLFGLENCVVLENGIDTEVYEKAITAPSDNVGCFAVLGRLGKRKGTYDLVEAVAIAAKAVPSIRCYLAGDGDVDQVKELIKKKDLEKNIMVLGWLDAAEKIELLKKVSVVVLPSYHEGLPMSLLEGMAGGKAIISTRVGAIPELIEQENGLLIDPGDINALAEALIGFSRNISMVNSMSKKNLEKIKKFYSLKEKNRLLGEYYEKVLGIH